VTAGAFGEPGVIIREPIRELNREWLRQFVSGTPSSPLLLYYVQFNKLFYFIECSSIGQIEDISDIPIRNRAFINHSFHYLYLSLSERHLSFFLEEFDVSAQADNLLFNRLQADSYAIGEVFQPAG